MKKIVIVVIGIYLLLAPFSYHPDTKLTLVYPALEHSSIWNIYGYLDSHKTNLPQFHYPPMHYWLLKALYPPLRLLGGSQFETWLYSGSNEAAGISGVYWFNLVSKLPVLLFTLLSGLVIYQLAYNYSKDLRKARWASLLWWLNPFTLYAAVMMGQNDIFALFPFLLGLLLMRRRPTLTALLWGLAAAIKTVPLLWILVVFLGSKDKKDVKTWLLLIIPFVVYGATLLPFVNFAYFKEAVLFSGLATRMFDARIDIGFGDGVMIAPLLLIVIGLIAHKYSLSKDLKGIASLLIATNLAILGWSHFNPQWFLWLIPFGSILLALTEESVMVWLGMLVSWVVVILTFEDVFLYWGIFSPLNPNLLNLPFIPVFLKSKGLDASLLRDSAQTFLACLSLFFIYRLTDIPADIKKSMVYINLKKLWLVALAVWLVVMVGINLMPGIKVVGKYSQPWEVKDINLSTYSTSVMVEGSLSYIDLLVKNPNLESKEPFTVALFDEQGNKLLSRDYSGYNVGDPTDLRVDLKNLPLISGHIYTITLSSTVEHTGMYIGLNKQHELFTREYYRYRPGIKDGLASVISLVITQWWWLALIVVISLVLFL